MPFSIMNDDIARSDLASCGTRRMRAKLLRRLHWLVCVRLHKHILPMDFASFKSLPLSPLSGALPDDEQRFDAVHHLTLAYSKRTV